MVTRKQREKEGAGDKYILFVIKHTVTCLQSIHLPNNTFSYKLHKGLTI